jgi:thiamine biosynthesis protein ThiS
MNLTVNGEAYVHQGAGSLADLLRELAAPPTRTAVMLNGEVTPRASWDAMRLAEGDRLEILTFAGGG